MCVLICIYFIRNMYRGPTDFSGFVLAGIGNN